MPPENDAEPFDRDRTDKLPVLTDAFSDQDIGDDAVRLDFSPAVPSVKTECASRLAGAESPPRTRIARIADQAASEALQTRLETLLHEAERHQNEARALRSVLAARDAAIGQVQRLLAERDAQLTALQREHAQAIPVLEERSQLTMRLETELEALRASYESLYGELQETRQTLTGVGSQLQAGKKELESTRRELDATKAQAAASLEHLRALEWRRDLDDRDIGPGGGSSRQPAAALREECDRLAVQLAEAQANLAARDETIARLNAAVHDVEAQRSQELQSAAEATAVVRARAAALVEERDRFAGQLAETDGKVAARDEVIDHLKATIIDVEAQHSQELKAAVEAAAAAHANGAALQEERDRKAVRLTELEAQLAARDQALTHLKAAATEMETQRSRELRAALEAAHAAEAARLELLAEVKRLQIEAQTRDDEHAALRAQLEPRVPVESSASEVERLTDELAAQTRALELVNEDNRSIRAALERARTSLYERELLIRRLERGDARGVEAPPVECFAELVRMNGQHTTVHTLSRRTRIGRAPGCELQIQSSSVSRHHALVVMNAREAIIEDLNSTNGVLVNGRRIARQRLNDGDVLTIGEAQFRLNLKLASEPAGRG